MPGHETCLYSTECGNVVLRESIRTRNTLDYEYYGGGSDNLRWQSGMGAENGDLDRDCKRKL